jgi:hypothetical protein
MPRSLYPQRKRSWYPLNRRLGAAQSCSGHLGKRHLLPLPEIEAKFLCCPARIPVARQTTGTSKSSRLPIWLYGAVIQRDVERNVRGLIYSTIPIYACRNKVTARKYCQCSPCQRLKFELWRFYDAISATAVMLYIQWDIIGLFWTMMNQSRCARMHGSCHSHLIFLYLSHW